MSIKDMPFRHYSPSEIEDALSFVWMIMAQGFRQAHKDTTDDEAIRAVRDEAEKVEQSLEQLSDFVDRRRDRMVDGTEIWVVNPERRKPS